MYTVSVVGHDGTEAVFALACPVLTLDVALRADRAGLPWRATSRGREHPLGLLRELADQAASLGPGPARHLRAVARSERLDARARLS